MTFETEHDFDYVTERGRQPSEEASDVAAALGELPFVAEVHYLSRQEEIRAVFAHELYGAIIAPTSEQMHGRARAIERHLVDEKGFVGVDVSVTDDRVAIDVRR